MQLKPTNSTIAEAFMSGLAVQARIVRALLIRDMMTRYGRANIGFLWVVLEPLILTAGVIVLWSTLKPPYEHGIQVISLVMTGYMPLTLWRHITGAGIFIFRRSMGLLYHRHITLLDALLARIVLEFIGTTCALFVVYLILLTFGLVAPIHDIGLVLMGWLSMGLLSFGVAGLFAVMTEYSEATERFISPIQYFMLPLSGSFFLVEWLPTKTRELALLNPTVHCYEMFRAGLFDKGFEAHYTFWYPALCGAVCLAATLNLIEVVRDKLNTG